MEDNERQDGVKRMKICVGEVGGKTVICLARRNILDMMIIDGEIDGEMINVSKKNIIRLKNNAMDMVAIDEYGFVVITDENELVIIDAEFKIAIIRQYGVSFKKILCVLNNNVLIDTEQGMYEFSIFIGDNFNSSNNGGKTSSSSQVNDQNDTHGSEGSRIEVMQLKPKEIQDILNISGITLEGDEFIAVCSKDRRRIGIYLHKEPEESKDKGGNRIGLESLIPELKYLGGIDDPLSSIESFSLVPVEVKGKIFISLIIFLRHGSDLLLEEHIFTSMENGESEGSDKLGSLKQKNIDLKTEHKELKNVPKEVSINDDILLKWNYRSGEIASIATNVRISMSVNRVVDLGLSQENYIGQYSPSLIAITDDVERTVIMEIGRKVDEKKSTKGTYKLDLNILLEVNSNIQVLHNPIDSLSPISFTNSGDFYSIDVSDDLKYVKNDMKYADSSMSGTMYNSEIYTHDKSLSCPLKASLTTDISKPSYSALKRSNVSSSSDFSQFPLGSLSCYPTGTNRNKSDIEHLEDAVSDSKAKLEKENAKRQNMSINQMHSSIDTNMMISITDSVRKCYNDYATHIGTDIEESSSSKK